MKILLAEDDHHIAMIARMALEKLGGHEVVHAADGEAALEKALQGTFTVILLDEMMPKLNGMAVAKKYLEQAKQPAPIIFLSAKSQAADIEMFKGQATGYIAKPFDPMTLSKQIEQILNQGQKRAA